MNNCDINITLQVSLKSAKLTVQSSCQLGKKIGQISTLPPKYHNYNHHIILLRLNLVIMSKKHECGKVDYTGQVTNTSSGGYLRLHSFINHRPKIITVQRRRIAVVHVPVSTSAETPQGHPLALSSGKWKRCYEDISGIITLIIKCTFSLRTPIKGS